MKILKDISGFEKFYLCALACMAALFLAVLIVTPLWGSMVVYISNDASAFSGFGILIGLSVVFAILPAAIVVILSAPIMVVPDVWRIVTKHLMPKETPWPYLRIALYLGAFFGALKIVEIIVS